MARSYGTEVRRQKRVSLWNGRMSQHHEPTIRTGCLACRARGVKCNGAGPGCTGQSASERWRVNNDVAWQWNGTWRERRGMHAFVNLAHSTKIVGLFESAFWHRTVLPACYHIPALFHLASGVGALFETAIQLATGYGTSDGGRDSFALAQCNRSIGLLTKRDNGAFSPEVALIASVLFTCFSGLQGEYETAGRHTLQGRQILNLVAGLESEGKTSGLVRSEDIRPILDNLEVQAKTVQGSGTQTPSAAIDPPLPDVSILHGLDHAHWTLCHAYSRLKMFCQNCPLDLDRAELIALQAEKIGTYSPWYTSWGISFTNLLNRLKSQDVPLDKSDTKRVDLLTLNFLHDRMLATTSQASTRSIFDAYVSDFQQIVQLASSVLQTFTFTVQTRVGKARYPYLNFGLWVDEPLFWTMSRCTNMAIRKKAASLLLGLRYADIVNKRNAGKVGGAWQEESWSAEDWIEFAGKTRFDYAMARFFGGFAEGFAERPVYDETCS